MSPDVRNLLVVIGIGAVIGAMAVPEEQRSTPVASTQAPAPATYQPEPLVVPALGSSPVIAAELPGTAMTPAQANDPLLIDLTGTSNRSLLPPATYSRVAPRSHAFDESVVATTRAPIVPTYTEPLSGRVRSSITGQAPLPQPIPSGRLGLSMSRSDASETILNRSGLSNQYFDQNGNSYTQAGPHGVTNNRTGEFRPTY